MHTKTHPTHQFSLNDWNREIYLQIPQNGLEHEEGFNCKNTKLLLLVKVFGGKSHHYPKNHVKNLT
jgi:hypothetical protein